MPSCIDCKDNDKCQEQPKKCKDCKQSVLPFVKKEGRLYCKLFELVVRSEHSCSSFIRKEARND